LPDTIDLKIVRNITNYLFITERVNEYDVLKTIIQKNSGKLIDLIDEDGIQRGVSPDLKEAFIVDSTTSEKYNLEKSYLKSVVTGGVHVKPFSIMKPDLLLIYTTRDTKYEEVPNICNYIEKYREKITCREVKENKHSIYSLHRSRDKNIFEKKSKLVGVITADRIIVSIDKTLLYCTDGLYVFGLKDSRLEEVLEAILNSNTITYIYRLLSMEEGRVLAQVKPAIINNLPMPNFPGSREIIDEIKQNVGNMKNMLRKRNDTHSESDKKIYADMIGRAIGMIDSCVYKLYGLTDDEIKIIEESTTP